MRYAFANELFNQAKKNKNIILLTADLGYSVFEEFANKLPNQYINVGVAEANMIGVAAGLALSGKTVFAYSISTFATLRAYESIRNDICLQNVKVIIVGSGAGLSYGILGPSHHGIEDIAVINTLPNIKILSPADPIEARWATKQAIKLKCPVYLRLGKRGEPTLYKNDSSLKFGKASILRKGDDYTIFSTGNILKNCLEAWEKLKIKGIEGTIVSIHTLKPADENTIIHLSKNKNVITVEEHRVIGGLGSIVGELLLRKGVIVKSFTKVGIPDRFITTIGDQNFLQKKYKLDASSIEKLILTKK